MREMKMADFIFYLALGMYIILSIMNTSLYAQYFPKFYKPGICMCCCLLFIREFVKKTSRRRFFLGLLTVLVIVIAIVGQSGANTILTIMIFAISASDLEFDDIAGISYKLISSGMLVVIASSMFGIIDDYVYIMAGKARHYMGFLYALQPAGLMLELMALSLYMHRNKRINKQFPFLLFGMVFVFIMTKSRLTFFLQIILILYDYMYKHQKKMVVNRIVCSVEKISYIFSVVFSFYFSLTYDKSRWKQLINIILANRLAYAKDSLTEHGVKLFGQKITWAGMGLSQNGKRTLESVWDGYNWVDNAYVQLFQLYGIVVALFFITILTLALFRLVSKKRYYLSFILFLYSMYGVIDTAPNTLLYNIFWLAVFNACISKHDEKNCKVKELGNYGHSNVCDLT